MVADVSLDVKGMACPLPVVKARLEMDKLETGALLEVLATDPGSVADFDNWTRMAGHELVESEQIDGVYRYVIRKGA